MRVYRVVIALVVVAVFGWTLGRIDWQTVLAHLAGARPAPLALAAVLVAPGAHWGRPDLPGSAARHVQTVDEFAPWLLDDDAPTPPRVVILGGDKAALGVASEARRRGAAVDVVHDGDVFAQSIGMVGRWRYVHEAQEQGISLHAETTVRAIEPGRVTLEPRGEAETNLEADAVWVVTGAQPAPALYDVLRAHGIQARAIGDCREFGLVEGALHDATRAALEI